MPSTGKRERKSGNSRQILFTGSLLAGSSSIHRKRRKATGTGYRTQFRLFRTRFPAVDRRDSLGFGRSQRARIARFLTGRKNDVHQRHQEQHHRGRYFKRRLHTAFIPTEFGVVHAVRTDGSGISWQWKVAHSAVTSLKNAGERRLIVMTMDGTVTCLKY